MRTIRTVVLSILYYSANCLYGQNVDMPGAGTTTVYTVGGKFYDEGGTGNYYSDADGILVLYPAITGMKVSIKFNSFVTESAGCSSDWDRLYIYNGNSTAATAMHPATNAGGFFTGCAANAMTAGQTFTSTAANGSLTIRFKADFSTTAAGWDADISLAGSPCGGTFVDAGGPANYFNDLNYSYTFTPPAGNYISLNFSAFQTESTGCSNNYDRFYLHDGNSTAAAAIHPATNSGGFWTGCAANAMTVPQTFASTAGDGTLTMRFKSDGTTVSSGWSAAVTCVSLAPCAGTPVAGTISISSSSGAGNINYTLSSSGYSTGTGISYQWQSSTDNVTFSNIAGATGSSYTTSSPTYSSVIYYRLVITCSNSGLSATSNVVSYTVSAWNHPAGSGSATLTTCSGTYYDHNGTGNYSANQNSSMTICPSSAGQALSATFTSFGVESGFDFLSVFDGNSTSTNMIPGSSFSGTSPGTITATTSNSSGCLTFQFYSDGSTQSSGWAATISCTATKPAPVVATQQDCYGGQTICSSQSFTANSNGSGQFNEVNFGLGNLGCLNDYGGSPDGSAEHQSSWYFFSATTSGTLGLTIVPSSSTTDYDWAIWGPYTNVTCPPTGTPLRCSAASSSNSTGGVTGLGNGAADTNEGSTGNGYVSTIPVTAGDQFVMLLDNWNATSAPFTLNWQLSNGASLDCTPLPLELLSFTGKSTLKGNILEWTTAEEVDHSHFEVQKSLDGKDFNFLELVDAKGERGEVTYYQVTDSDPLNQIMYYRLKQVDNNGNAEYSLIVTVENTTRNKSVVTNLFPNPANDFLQLKLDDNFEGDVEIKLIDALGKEVLKSKRFIKEDFLINLDISTVSEGVYFVRISGKGWDEGQKLVVLK